ncbi:DUF6221 family protein [Streptomyces sp. NPDC058700]|uniref:DUF6221 family protein n=1 Tax=Streptomyces sp. NPDC058700 TaxID=3346607 RepID=UPI00364C22B0
MDDLIAFLRARLDDDAAIARAAAEVCGCHEPAGRWAFDDDENDGRIVIVDDPHPEMKRKVERRWNGSYDGLFAARHIARHDPARVLAEVDAKRRIVDECAYWIDKINKSATDKYPYPNLAERGEVVLPVLCLLALPYSGHPEFDDAWRP